MALEENFNKKRDECYDLSVRLNVAKCSNMHAYIRIQICGKIVCKKLILFKVSLFE